MQGMQFQYDECMCFLIAKKKIVVSKGKEDLLVSKLQPLKKTLSGRKINVEKRGHQDGPWSV